MDLTNKTAKSLRKERRQKQDSKLTLDSELNAEQMMMDTDTNSVGGGDASTSSGRPSISRQPIERHRYVSHPGATYNSLTNQQIRERLAYVLSLRRNIPVNNNRTRGSSNTSHQLFEQNDDNYSFNPNPSNRASAYRQISETARHVSFFSNNASAVNHGANIQPYMSNQSIDEYNYSYSNPSALNSPHINQQIIGQPAYVLPSRNHSLVNNAASTSSNTNYRLSEQYDYNYSSKPITSSPRKISTSRQIKENLRMFPSSSDNSPVIKLDTILRTNDASQHRMNQSSVVPPVPALSFDSTYDFGVPEISPYKTASNALGNENQPDDQGATALKISPENQQTREACRSQNVSCNSSDMSPTSSHTNELTESYNSTHSCSSNLSGLNNIFENLQTSEASEHVSPLRKAVKTLDGFLYNYDIGIPSPSSETNEPCNDKQSVNASNSNVLENLQTECLDRLLDVGRSADHSCNPDGRTSGTGNQINERRTFNQSFNRSESNDRLQDLQMPAHHRYRYSLDSNIPSTSNQVNKQRNFNRSFDSSNIVENRPTSATVVGTEPFIAHSRYSRNINVSTPCITNQVDHHHDSHESSKRCQSYHTIKNLKVSDMAVKPSKASDAHCNSSDNQPSNISNIDKMFDYLPMHPLPRTKRPIYMEPSSGNKNQSNKKHKQEQTFNRSKSDVFDHLQTLKMAASEMVVNAEPAAACGSYSYNLTSNTPTTDKSTSIWDYLPISPPPRSDIPVDPTSAAHHSQENYNQSFNRSTSNNVSNNPLTTDTVVNVVQSSSGNTSLPKLSDSPLNIDNQLTEQSNESSLFDTVDKNQKPPKKPMRVTSRRKSNVPNRHSSYEANKFAHLTQMQLLEEDDYDHPNVSEDQGASTSKKPVHTGVTSDTGKPTSESDNSSYPPLLTINLKDYVTDDSVDSIVDSDTSKDSSGLDDSLLKETKSSTNASHKPAEQHDVINSNIIKDQETIETASAVSNDESLSSSDDSLLKETESITNASHKLTEQHDDISNITENQETIEVSPATSTAFEWDLLDVISETALNVDDQQLADISPELLYLEDTSENNSPELNFDYDEIISSALAENFNLPSELNSKEHKTSTGQNSDFDLSEDCLSLSPFSFIADDISAAIFETEKPACNATFSTNILGINPNMLLKDLVTELDAYSESAQMTQLSEETFENLTGEIETCGSVEYDSEDQSHLTASKAFKCLTCAKSFKTSLALYRHKRNHITSAGFVCEFCGRKFLQERYLHVHVKRHTDDTIASKPSQAQKHTEHDDESCICEQCGIYCKSNFHLKIHMVKHINDKPFKCEICYKQFKRSNDLKGHMQFHADTEQHICDVCDKVYFTKSNLEFHYLKEHFKIKSFICGACNISFKSNFSLKRHMAAIHAGEKYKCHICNKLFTQKCKITAHMKMHDKRRANKFFV